MPTSQPDDFDKTDPLTRKLATLMREKLQQTIETAPKKVSKQAPQFNREKQVLDKQKKQRNILRQYDERKGESIVEHLEETEVKERFQDMDLKFKDDLDYIETNKRQAQEYCIQQLLKKSTKPDKIEKAFKPLENFLNEVNSIVCEA